jgi:hypothetical protein
MSIPIQHNRLTRRSSDKEPENINEDIESTIRRFASEHDTASTQGRKKSNQHKYFHGDLSMIKFGNSIRTASSRLFEQIQSHSKSSSPTLPDVIEENIQHPQTRVFGSNFKSVEVPDDLIAFEDALCSVERIDSTVATFTASSYQSDGHVSSKVEFNEFVPKMLVSIPEEITLLDALPRKVSDESQMSNSCVSPNDENRSTSPALSKVEAALIFAPKILASVPNGMTGLDALPRKVSDDSQFSGSDVAPNDENKISSPSRLPRIYKDIPPTLEDDCPKFWRVIHE